MKNLFRIICIILAFVMISGSVFASVADNHSEEAYKLYQEAVKRLEKVHSLEVSGTTVQNLSDKDISWVNRYNYEAKIRADEKGSFEYSIYLISTTEGIDDIRMYLKDNWRFLRDGNKKTRTRHETINLKDGHTGANKAAIIGFPTGIPKECFKDATVEKLENGHRVNVNITGEYMHFYFNTDWDKYKMESANVSMVIDNVGRVRSYRTTHSYTFSRDGVTNRGREINNIRFKPYNSVEKIDFPDDLNSFRRV